MIFFLQSYGQLTLSTAENLAEGAVVSGTVTDNNNGPVNIPFHFYRTQLTGNGMISVISQITNSSMTAAGNVWLSVYFKDSTLFRQKVVAINPNSTLVDTFLVTGAEQDEVYIVFQNYGVVYGGPFNYTTHYDLLFVEPNNETEPNNYHNLAQVLHPGDMIDGHISYSSDGYYVDLNDFYDLVMPENGQVDLEFSWVNTCIQPAFTIPGPSVYLYGKDSVVNYGSIDHSSSGHANVLTLANTINSPFGVRIYDTMHVYGKTADTIRISLYNYFSGFGIPYCGSYTMKYLMSDLAPSNELEPNNSLSTANDLSVGDTIQGLISYSNGNFVGDPDDYFKIIRPAGDSLRFYISSINKNKYDSLSANASVFIYDKNGNPLNVYSSTGTSSGGNLLIGNVYLQTVDGFISDTMTVRGIPTDSLYIRVYSASAAFKYELMPLSPFTGIDKLSGQNPMSVFPNPATEKITISLQKSISEEVEINLISLTGANVAKLFSGRLNSLEKTLELPETPSGTYFISIQSKNGIESFQKIVIGNK